MQVPHNSFVVVADGKKMLFFRNEGDAQFPKLEVERKLETADPRAEDGSGRPRPQRSRGGRVQQL